MPKFNEFIKGFEEPEQPKVKTQPKAQEIETKKPKVEESEFSKSRPAFTHDFAESLRKDAINWANEKMPYDKSLPKILNNYTRDEVIDFMRGNIGEDEIMKRAKERNGINQDRVNLLAKQEATKPQPKPAPKPGSFDKMIEGFDKKEARPLQAEQYHKPEDRGFEPNPQPAKPTAPKKEFSVEAHVGNYFKDPSFKKSTYGDNFYENSKGEEYWVGTPEQATEAAKQEVLDFMNTEGVDSFTPEFKDWIYENAVSEQGMKQLREDYAEMFREMGQPEDAEWILGTDDNNLRAFIINSFPDT